MEKNKTQNKESVDSSRKKRGTGVDEGGHALELVNCSFQCFLRWK